MAFGSWFCKSPLVRNRIWLSGADFVSPPLVRNRIWLSGAGAGDYGFGVTLGVCVLVLPPGRGVGTRLRNDDSLVSARSKR